MKGRREGGRRKDSGGALWCAGRKGLLAAGHGALSAKAVLLCTVVLFEGRLQYTALVQTQLEAGGGAWGHLVWQGHYLAARQGKSVVAGTHPRIPSNPDGHSRSAQRWQVGNRRGGGAGLQEIILPNLGPGSTGAQAVTRSQHTSHETEILIQKYILQIHFGTAEASCAKSLRGRDYEEENWERFIGCKAFPTTSSPLGIGIIYIEYTEWG